jgi:hypothetical protein
VPSSAIGAWPGARPPYLDSMGNVVLYQRPDQNALHNEVRAVRRKGTGWAGGVGRSVIGRAPGLTVV